MDKLFSTGNIKEFCGFPPTTLNDWVDDGFVTPVQQGEGKGNHRGFSMMQVIGIAVADALRKTDRGCAMVGVGLIVDAFSHITETDLLKMFAKHGTSFVSVHQGKPVLTDKKYDDSVNVQTIYQNVKRYAERKAKQTPHAKGRNKGLVGASK